MRPPRWLLKIASAHFERRRARQHRDPRGVQEALLRRCLLLYRDTELGKALRLQEVRSPDEYARSFPARTEADYKPHWQRAKAENRPGLVHPRRLKYMASSSGTSGDGDKNLPCPPELLATYQRFTNHALFHAMRILDDHSLLEGKCLVTAAPPVKEVTPNGITVGFSSGIATLEASRLAREWIRPGRATLDVTDWRERIERTVDEAFDLDVRVLTGVPVCVVPLLEAVLARAARRGQRATCVRDVWPNLRLYLFSGTPLLLYRERIRGLLGEGVEFFEAYSSTESPFAFQHRFGSSDLVVDLETCYLEFEPLGAEPGAPRLRLHETRAGAIYRLVVTTMGGLFAYRMGDLVEITATTPEFLLTFAGREVEEISVGAEHMTARQAGAALDAACAEVGVRAGPWFVCPVERQGRLGHEWGVELGQPIDPAALAGAIDRQLVARNKTYGTVRGGEMLAPPLVSVLAPGSIERWLLEHGRYGQSKVLQLYGTRDVPDRILAFARAQGPRAAAGG